MAAYKIKDIQLANRITEGQIDWFRYVSPITAYYADQIAKKNYQGKKNGLLGACDQPKYDLDDVSSETSRR